MSLIYLLTLIGAVALGYYITTLDVPLRKPMNIDYLSEQYWFSRYPEGAFSVPPPYTVDPQKFLFWAGLGLILPMLWILINMPDVASVTLVYLLMVAIFFSAAMLEYMFPKRMVVTGLLGWGGMSYEVQVLVGVSIAAVSILLFCSAPERFAFVPFQVVSLGHTLAAFYLTVVAIPWIEEFIFGNLIPSSVIEEMGIVPGVAISAFVFSIFHSMVYSSNIYLLMAAFTFRALASVALVRFTSFLPGYVGHVVVNFVGFVLG